MVEVTLITPPPYIDNDGTELERLCQECKGYGVVWNPIWKAWTEQWKAAGEPALDSYTGDHPMPEEEEEVQCGKCGGSGWQLTTRGLALVDFLRRHMR